ncbi:hypothetical protein [Cupriavidus basilensis]|uniref:Uncharacterized protein n=1 Tax=Cupriavidus basilensis TaxID=68895 RepID=A0A643FWX1_9BURK|nr:hypothetical protein [Cupriavidus basilensis]QOT81533.1 hypothetical protein F7R26_028955 [Cupriavidus basilensis]
MWTLIRGADGNVLPHHDNVGIETRAQQRWSIALRSCKKTKIQPQPLVWAWPGGTHTMSNLSAIELKAFVPARDEMRDFVLLDPSGVLWRIGQNLA